MRTPSSSLAILAIDGEPDSPADAHAIPATGGPDRHAWRSVLSREGWVVASCCCIFVSLAAVRAWGRSIPEYDESAFLEIANRVRELGGPGGLLRELFAGRWTEGNRNPLYPALLSLVATRGESFHRAAQALQLLLALGAFLALWWVVRAHAGRRAALCFAALLTVAETFLDYSSKEACEPMLLIAWAFAISAYLKSERSPGRWLLAGAWAGVALLTKGSGLVLLATFLIAALVHRGRRAFASPWPWLGCAAFALVASPLLICHLRVYGDPFYNWNNRIFWMNKVADVTEWYAPHVFFDRFPQGPLGYLAQLSPVALAWRLVEGPAGAALYLGRALSFTVPQPLFVASAGLGLLAASYATWLLWRARASGARTFLLVQLVVWELLAAAYSAAGQSARYVLPMSIGLLAVLAVRAARVVPPRRAGLAIGALACATLAFSPLKASRPAGYLAVRQWLREHVQAGQACAIDARSLLLPEWSLPPTTRQEIIAASWQGKPLPADELISYFQERRIDYVVIDASSNTDGAPRWFFSDQVRLSADGSLPLTGYPAGFSVVYADEEGPRRWVVLHNDRLAGAPLGPLPRVAESVQMPLTRSTDVALPSAIQVAGATPNIARSNLESRPPP
jgi:hypothetical protein